MEVVIHLLVAGIPLRKADHLRPLLEKHHLRLVSSTHLYNLIPAVRQMEFEKTKAAIAGRDVSVIFDGSTRLGEAVAIWWFVMSKKRSWLTVADWQYDRGWRG